MDLRAHVYRRERYFAIFHVSAAQNVTARAAARREIERASYFLSAPQARSCNVSLALCMDGDRRVPQELSAAHHSVRS